MKPVRVVFSLLAVSFAASFAVAGEVYNLGAKLRAEHETDPILGWILGASATKGDYSGLSGERLFDGDVFQASEKPYDSRWLVSVYTHGVGNVFAQLCVPDSYRPNKTFILRKYRLFRGSYWRKADRDPRQWKIYGIPDGATADPSRWVLLVDQSTDFTGYPGSCTAAETNEFTVTATGDALAGFRGFRFVPTSTGFYAKSVADGKKADTYDLDMREIEFDVEEVDAPARAPMRIVDYFKERGGSLRPYYASTNMYADLDYCSSFDGLRSKTDNNGTFRCLGYMGLPGGVFVELNLENAAERRAGDTFYLGDYRIYTLFNNGNETQRIPTSWTLQVATGGQPLSVADAQTDYAAWGSFDFIKATTDNFQKFRPSQVLPFDHVRFVPTDSYAQSTEGKTGNELNVGWMEIDLYMSPANAKGTLRVKTSKAGGLGFEPAVESLVTEAATLTAPANSRVGDEMLAVSGHYLEYFDFDTAHWQYKLGSYSTDRTYSYTPDPNRAERLVWVISETRTGVNVTVDATALVGKERVEGQGLYGIGDTVTLTACPSDDELTAASSSTNLFHSTFVRWEGDMAGLGIDPTSAQISYTLDRKRDIRPTFARDWLLFTYDKANEGGTGAERRIKNGVWEFKVNDPVDDPHKLTMLTYGHCGGRGDLDFTEGRIYCPGDAQPYVIRTIENAVMGITGDTPTSERTLLTSLVLPPEVETIGQSAFRSEEAMTNLVMNCPLLDEIAYCQFTRNLNLRHVELDLPNVRNIANNWAFFNVPFTETDASTWNLSAVTNVGYQTFAGDDTSKMRARCAGVLDLPALITLGQQAFQVNWAFPEIRLGTARRTLRRIAAAAFNYALVTNVVLGTTADLTVMADSFTNVNDQTGLRCVTFTGVAPTDRVMVDRVLLMNDLTQSGHAATLNVPLAKVRSWRPYVTATADIADATVKAEAEARGADGVWIAADGTYKAYVRYFGPQAPGGVLLVR